MHIPLPLLLTLAPSLIPATPIHPRQLNTTTTDTSNQLTDNTPCRPLTLIFARGTFEPGNLGSLTGPPFITALSSAIGASNLAVQGVDYPADVAGFEAGGDVGGSALMAELVGMAMGKCPGTKVVMGGYSQGGQLVHNAANLLSSEVSEKVNSVVIFGDPDDGSAVGSIPASKTLVVCHVGDDICLHGDLILPAHLDYAIDAGTAAAFVAKAARYPIEKKWAHQSS